MIALDTNIVAYFFRGEGHVAANLMSTRPDEVAIPSIVAYELHYGFAKLPQPGKHLPKLQELLRWIKVLPFDAATASIAGSLRAGLEKRGRPIGPHDLLIAATAVQHSAMLATRNIREFAGIRELKVANWFDEPPALLPNEINEIAPRYRVRKNRTS